MRSPTVTGRIPGLLLLAALALLAVPVLSVRMPPLLDYPNHFARIWLLAGGADAPPVSDFYAVDWSAASTNLGVDLLAAALGVFLPVTVLGPLLLLAAVILPPFGAAALNRSAFGGWHWWQVGFAALAWSATLLAGFLNFQIGIGLALVAAALDPSAARLRPTAAFAVRAAFAALISLAHAFGVLFYAALVAGLALGPSWRMLGSTRELARGSGRAVVAVAAAAVPVVALLFFAPVLPWEEARTVASTEWAPFSVRHKVGLLLTSVRNYWRFLDLALVALLAMPALWALAAGRLRFHGGLLLASAGFVLLLLVAPFRLGGVGWVEERFPVMALLTLAAALRPDFVVSRPAGATFAAALLGVSAVRTALVGVVWHERQADVVAVERALAHMPTGARLLPMEHTPAQGVFQAPPGRFIETGGLRRGNRFGTYWHYPVLAVPWRQAYVPTLFARRGNQPIRVLPPRDTLVSGYAFPLSVGALLAEDPTLHKFEPEWYGRVARHLAHWREQYDYVLVVNADMPDGTGPARPVPGLELVADEGFARLFRVRPPVRRDERPVASSNHD